jgi:hypothetical protein
MTKRKIVHSEKPKLLAKKELEQDKAIIKKLLERFGDKWRKLGES